MARPDSIQAILDDKGSDRLKLFSGSLNPESGERLSVTDKGFDILDDLTGLPKKRFLINGDQSTEEIDLKADGRSYARRETFFSALPGEPRHRHVTQVYSAISDLVVDETSRRFEGTTQEHTTTSEKGDKSLRGYGLDGKRIIHELEVLAPEESYLDPTLLREERWTDNAAHNLIYSNLFDPKDKTRAIKEWNQDRHLLKVTHVPQYGPIGETIQALYPGTKRLRLDVEVKKGATVANYLREEDGAINYVLRLCQGSTSVDYYDPAGKRVLFTQKWHWHIEVENGQTKKVYTIDTVTEQDEKGLIARLLYFWEGKLSSIHTFNRTVDGKLYGEIDSIYDRDSGTLARVWYWLGKADHKYDREDLHTPAEKILAPDMKDLLTLRVNLDLDDLPIPPPSRGPY
jgi:hypothetical protein